MNNPEASCGLPPRRFSQDEQKRAVAEHAVALVENRMVVGLGSGTTSEMALHALARRVTDGLRITGIPTSRHIATLARQLGIPLTGFSHHLGIDIALDGADQVELGGLALIKGGGGALLREKIIASTSQRFVAMVDASKIADRLGGSVALPVEVAPFGREIAAERLTALECEPTLRRIGDKPFVTDNGNNIFDCRIAPIADPAAFEERINTVVGVVENGLFCNLASTVLIGRDGGVEVIER